MTESCKRVVKELAFADGGALALQELFYCSNGQQECCWVVTWKAERRADDAGASLVFEFEEGQEEEAQTMFTKLAKEYLLKLREEEASRTM